MIHPAINIENFIAVKGYKALGNKLTNKKIKEINLLDPLPYKDVAIQNTNDNIISEVTEEHVKSKIELEITNIGEEESSKDADSEDSGGQITLEL